MTPFLRFKVFVANMPFELRYHMSWRKRRAFKIMNGEDSLRYLIDHKCSMSRFGDGEFLQTMGYLNRKSGKYNLGFQKYDEQLGKRLAEILLNNDCPSLMIGLPSPLFGREFRAYKFCAQYHWMSKCNEFIDDLYKYLPLEKVYLDSYITRFYMDYKFNEEKFGKHVDLLKQLWAGRSLLIVEGEHTRLGVGNDLFEGASSIRRIVCPPVNAFSRIGDIEKAILSNCGDNSLVLLALGPTATVVAYDMAKEGIQAMDIGHIDIEYMWYILKAKNKEGLPGKYVNELANPMEMDAVPDKNYLSQIVERID